MSNTQPNGFTFTVTNGQVTGLARVHGTHTSPLKLPANATFVVGTDSITETLTQTKETIVRQFVHDSVSSTLYHVGSETVTVTNPTTTYGNGYTFGYGFTVSNGKVTAEQITSGASGHTHSHKVAIAPTASFVVNGTQITETLVVGNVVETIKFVQTGSAGLYAVVSDSKTFVQAGSATTHLSVEPFERAKFTLDASNHITQVQSVHLDGSVSTVKPHSGTTFTQLAAGYVVETVTRGNHSRYEVFHDGNGDGIYTSVAHGAGTTVDLVGLKAQISGVIDAVT